MKRECATCGWRKDLNVYPLAGGRALLCKGCAADRQPIPWKETTDREKLAITNSTLVHVSAEEKAKHRFTDKKVQ